MGTPVELSGEALATLGTLADNVVDRFLAGQRDRAQAAATAAPGRRDLPKPHQPTFDGSGTSNWAGFVSRFATFKSVTGLNDEQSKSFLHLSLVGEAATVGIDFPPENYTTKTFREYQTTLGSVFAPASERALHRVRFLERKQSENETIQRYLIAKRTLFTIAYGPTTNRELLTTLFTESAKGILNANVARTVLGKLETYANFTALLECASASVATERSLALAGKANSTVGLQAVQTAAADPAASGVPHVAGSGVGATQPDAVGASASAAPVPMELGNVNFLDLVADPDIFQNLPDSVIAAVPGMTGFACYTCQDPRHGWRQCPRRAMSGVRQAAPQRGSYNTRGGYTTNNNRYPAPTAGRGNFGPGTATRGAGRGGDRSAWRSGPPSRGAPGGRSGYVGQIGDDQPAEEDDDAVEEESQDFGTVAT